MSNCIFRPTKHFRDRMIERNISTTIAEEVIKNGRKRKEKGKTIVFYRGVEIVYKHLKCTNIGITIYSDY